VYDDPAETITKAGSSDEKDQSSRLISVGKETRKFELTERANKRLPFNTFYTTNLTEYEVQPVEFTTENRFEGRSSYFHYYPTDTLLEQRMEKVWFEAQNRKM